MIIAVTEKGEQMSRYIDADAYKNVLEKLRHRGIFPKSSDVEILRNYLDEFSTADVQPVVRGEWIDRGYDLNRVCSVCRHMNMPDNFCPNCGADMRGGNDGN